MSIWAMLWLSLLALFVMSILAAIAGSVVHKAGFSRWYGLLILVPVVNVIALYVFAFIKWPAAERIE